MSNFYLPQTKIGASVTVNDDRPLPVYQPAWCPGPVELLPLIARTADGSGTVITNDKLRAKSLLIVLNVTAKQGTTPTLDVVIQAKVETRYFNLCRFTQLSNAIGDFALNVKRGIITSTMLTLETDPAVGTGLLINSHEWFGHLRCKWDIGGSDTPGFTFSVEAHPIH